MNAERAVRLKQRSVRAVRNHHAARNRRMERRRDKAQVTLLYREALEKDEKLKNSLILKKTDSETADQTGICQSQKD